MILFSDDNEPKKHENQPSWLERNGDPEKLKDPVAPLTFLPVEVATIVFPVVRIVYNIFYFIAVIPRIFNGQYGDYLWIGHIIESGLVIVAFFLHSTRLYIHWEPIYGISKENPRCTLLFTLSITSWAICTYLYYYFGEDGLYEIFGEHYYIFCVIILTFFTGFTMVVSYLVFAKLYVDQGEIDWVTGWIDSPLIAFNLCVQIFLILERDIWVNIWMGDFLYHMAEYVLVITKWCKKIMNADENVLAKHQKENGHSGMIDVVPNSRPNSGSVSTSITDVVV